MARAPRAWISQCAKAAAGEAMVKARKVVAAAQSK
jgi:hypothetical protein